MIAGGRGDPRLPARDRRRERRSTATSASTTRCSARPGRPTRRAGPSTSSTPTPASAARSAAGWLFCGRGYYRYDEGYTPQFAGSDEFAGPDRPPAAVARGPRLRRQARRRDRQRRDRGDADPRDGPDGRARDDAAALAELHPVGAREGRDRQRAAPGCSARSAPTAITRRKNILQQRAIYRFCQRCPRRRAG